MNIIQVGCHVGKDRVQNFIEENYNKINRGILIDANEECLNICKESYKHLSKIEFFHYAIVPGDEKTINFYIPTESFGHTVIGSVSEGFVDTQTTSYKTVVAPSINLNTFFKEQNINKIDRLYIDAETLDIDIVNSINFSEVNIDFLFFEKLHSDYKLSKGGPKYENCIQKLKERGYIIQDLEFDTLAIKV